MTADFAHAAAAAELVRYAQVWEDHRVLSRALAVTPDDDVLSIGSAGCNVLALLLDGPRHITAVDLNPAQSALIELKLTALRRLTYDELTSLVGAREGHDRLALYDRLRPHLATTARRFWDVRPDDLAEGVMHTGRFERYFQRFQREHVKALVPAEAIAQLLSLDDRDAQRALFDGCFDTPAFRRAFVASFGREAQARDGRDPSQLRYVGALDVTAMLWERFRYACTELATRGNFYLEYFLTGGYRDLDEGPPYLRRDVFEQLRARVDRVEIVTADLASHLAAVPPGRYSKVNLSNVFEYLSEPETETIFAALTRAVRPGGRLAFWNLFVPRAPSAPLRARLRSHAAEAGGLWRRDRAFFYRAFHLEEVLP
jgi:S-adenosylmethionine-diacylglycerol 3-amino-3-carboxypropyl transferase